MNEIFMRLHFVPSRCPFYCPFLVLSGCPLASKIYLSHNSPDKGEFY